MQSITVNQAAKLIIPLPTAIDGDSITYKVFKASDKTIFASGNMAYQVGIQWMCLFTPSNLNEIYILEVYDAGGDVIFSESYKALGVVWDASVGPSGVIVVGVNSFLTAQEAEDYFITRVNVGTIWSSQTDNNKIAALVTAYKQLTRCDRFDFPVDIAQAMKDAQCEQALFLLQQGSDIDSRKALQAQGVIQAGIVKEAYKEDAGEEMAICAIALQMLGDYRKDTGNFFTAELDRDEDAGRTL